MCCESERHHGGKHPGHHHGHGRHSGSCCCGHSDFGPCFWTKEEKIARLEEFLAGLQEQVKAVEERIAALREE